MNPSQNSSSSGWAASAPWWLGIILTMTAASVAYWIYRMRKKDDGLKERADGFRRLADDYSLLLANQASLLTHEAERERFRRDAKRLLGPSATKRCLDALGEPDALVCKRAIERASEDADRARDGRSRVRAFDEHLRVAEQAHRADFELLQREFTLGAASRDDDA